MINKKIKPDDLIRRAFPLKKLARTNQLYMKIDWTVTYM